MTALPSMNYCPSTLRSLHIAADSFDRQMSVLTNLEELVFMPTRTGVTSSDFASLYSLRQLRHLQLPPVLKLDSVILPTISGFSDLEVLRISNSTVSKAALQHLTHLSKLHTLSITGCMAAQQSLRFLSALSGLTELDLSKSNFSLRDMIYLTTLQKLQTFSCPTKEPRLFPLLAFNSLRYFHSEATSLTSLPE